MKSRKITIVIILTVVPLLDSAELRSVDGDLTNFDRSVAAKASSSLRG